MRKAYQKRYKRHLAERQYALAMERLGGKCSRCGFDDKRILELHHISGEGILKTATGHRIRFGRMTWKDFESMLPHLILLCPNCHALTHLDPEIEKYNPNFMDS